MNENPLSLNTAEPVDPELLTLVANTDEANNAPQKSKLRRMWEQAQVQRMLNLIPHGKHKDQHGTKGAFGKRKRLASK